MKRRNKINPKTAFRLKKMKKYIYIISQCFCERKVVEGFAMTFASSPTIILFSKILDSLSSLMSSSENGSNDSHKSLSCVKIRKNAL